MDSWTLSDCLYKEYQHTTEHSLKSPILNIVQDLGSLTSIIPLSWTIPTVLDIFPEQ